MTCVARPRLPAFASLRQVPRSPLLEIDAPRPSMDKTGMSGLPGCNAARRSAAVTDPSFSSTRPRAARKRTAEPLRPSRCCRPVARVLGVAMLTLASGCTPGGSCDGPSSGCVDQPATACRSWSIFIAPGWAGGSEPQIAPDRSVAPARADLKVGARIDAGVDFVALDPPGCSGGVLDSRPSWRTSDAGILRLAETARYTATLIGVSPGTAHVFADGLNQPGGRTGSIELSICADAAATQKACARTPLEIRVVP